MPLLAVWLWFAWALVLMECTQKSSAQKRAAVCASWNTIGSLTNDLPDPTDCPILPDFAWFCLILPHRIPDQWSPRSNGLPDFAWFCLILPDFAWKCLKRAWFCLKLPETPDLPEIAWKGAWIRLKRRKQMTMTWRPESDWFCLMCFFVCLELSENAGKEWGRWATPPAQSPGP